MSAGRYVAMSDDDVLLDDAADPFDQIEVLVEYAMARESRVHDQALADQFIDARNRLGLTFSMSEGLGLTTDQGDGYLLLPGCQVFDQRLDALILTLARERMAHRV